MIKCNSIKKCPFSDISRLDPPPPWLLISLVFGVEWYNFCRPKRKLSDKFHIKLVMEVKFLQGGAIHFHCPPPLPKKNLTVQEY